MLNYSSELGKLSEGSGSRSGMLPVEYGMILEHEVPLPSMIISYDSGIPL